MLRTIYVNDIANIDPWGEAFDLLPDSVQHDPELRFFVPRGTKKRAVQWLSARSDARTLTGITRHFRFEPYGVRVFEMPGLRNRVVLTTWSNWTIGLPGLPVLDENKAIVLEKR